MKIALCLSGQPRFVEKAFPNIYENLIRGYDVDVFVHSWIDEDKSYQFRNDGIWRNVTQDVNINSKILDLYKPKKFLFEKPKTFNVNIINGEKVEHYFKPLWESKCNHFNNPDGAKYFVNMIHSMWYSIMMSNLQKELYSKESNINYDLVIRARFDVTYRYKLIYENINPNIMNVSSQVHHDHIHDFFAISNDTYMNTYCSLFYNLNYYLSVVRPDWRCGEGILFKLMEKYNIPCQGIDFIDILRP